MRLLDFIFHLLHIATIVINTTFWVHLRTLWLAQISLSFTLISWLLLGPFYGFGYCFLTDWHWQVKESLGETDLPSSYIKYMVDYLTHGDWSASVVDFATVIVAAISVAGCSLQTYRKSKLRHL